VKLGDKKKRPLPQKWGKSGERILIQSPRGRGREWTTENFTVRAWEARREITDRNDEAKRKGREKRRLQNMLGGPLDPRAQRRYGTRTAQRKLLFAHQQNREETRAKKKDTLKKRSKKALLEHLKASLSFRQERREGVS